MTPVNGAERAAEIIEALDARARHDPGMNDCRIPRPTRASHSARYPAGPTAARPRRPPQVGEVGVPGRVDPRVVGRGEWTCVVLPKPLAPASGANPAGLRSGGVCRPPRSRPQAGSSAMSLEKIVWVIIIVAYFIKGWNDELTGALAPVAVGFVVGAGAGTPTIVRVALPAPS